MEKKKHLYVDVKENDVSPHPPAQPRFNYVNVPLIGFASCMGMKVHPPSVTAFDSAPPHSAPPLMPLT